METADDFITIARVLRTQGRRGEVAVEPHSDVPDRFKAGLKLSALGTDGRRRELEIEDIWPHKQSLVLKFAGVDSISDAEPLVGCELQVGHDQRAQLEPGWTFIHDLIGCTVFNGSSEIGRITDVRLGAGEASRLIVQSANKEHEIPFAQAYLQNVDLSQRAVKMLLPDGMLDLDAPLSEEEKQQQRKNRSS